MYGFVDYDFGGWYKLCSVFDCLTLFVCMLTDYRLFLIDCVLYVINRQLLLNSTMPLEPPGS